MNNVSTPLDNVPLMDTVSDEDERVRRLTVGAGGEIVFGRVSFSGACASL